jgi:hypothetical protein
MTDETKNTYEGYPQLRAVTRKDRVRMSGLIALFAEKSGNEALTKMLPKSRNEVEKPESKEAENKDKDPEKSSEEMYDMIKTVLNGMITWIENDVTEWFMDLIGCESIEAFDELPVDIEVYIIEQLMEQEAFSNFFLKASVIFNKARGLIK